MPLNPNSAKAYVDAYPFKSTRDKARDYPQFFEKLTLTHFRQVDNLTLNFKHPITVISGTNRSGKTTSLMAIACSHYNFDRQDPSNGSWERATWSSLVRFTPHDIQNEDWTYSVEYRMGILPSSANGYRRHATKKWGGVAKKQGQIGKPTNAHINGGRHTLLIDLNRIVPGRHLSQAHYDMARNAGVHAIANEVEIKEYLSYILESDYDVNEITNVADTKIFGFVNTGHEYTSFNTASGEDVLTNILGQILHEPDDSLILIDEIEIGLHPKVQRRLMDILYIISHKKHMQFIVTTHSYAILDSVPKEARLFIENNGAGQSRIISLPSTYEILTRIDSETFPLTTIYVEDEESQGIVNKAISEINNSNPGFSRLLNVVVVGTASKTYTYFTTRKDLLNKEKLVTKPICILDGDMENQRDGVDNLLYPQQVGLFFHYSNEAPEKMMLRFYLANHPNPSLQYHLDNSNPHCLFEKMVEAGVAQNKKDAFENCFKECHDDPNGNTHFNSLMDFIKQNCE